MAFALSRAGQELLLEPKISRIPAMQRGDFFDSVPGTYPNIHGVALRAKVRFDAGLAQQRFTAVSQLFDQTITSLLPELQAATKAIHFAEEAVALRRHANAEKLLQRARNLAYAIDAGDPSLLKPLPGSGKDADQRARAPSISAPDMQSAARLRYAQARQLALEAAALAGS